MQGLRKVQLCLLPQVTLRLSTERLLRLWCTRTGRACGLHRVQRVVEHDGGGEPGGRVSPCLVLVTSRNFRLSLPMKGFDEEYRTCKLMPSEVAGNE